MLQQLIPRYVFYTQFVWQHKHHKVHSHTNTNISTHFIVLWIDVNDVIELMHTHREREKERICNRVLYSRFSILWLQCQEHRIKNVKIRNNPISIGENGNATHLWFSSHLILLSVFITYAFYFRLLTVNSFTLNRKKK